MKKHFNLLFLFTLLFLVFLSCDKENIKEEPIKEEIPDFDTLITFPNISSSSFSSWSTGDFRFIKGRLSRISKGSAWGTEVSLTDIYGNSSRNLYTTPYGCFTFPLVIDANDNIFKKDFVFNIVKDTYISSSQLGFGGTKSSCYDGQKWNCDYTYGIDYFDDIKKGHLEIVDFDQNLKMVYIKMKKYNITVYFPELTQQSDISKFDNFKGKTIYINIIQRNNRLESVVDHSGDIQISDHILL